MDLKTTLLNDFKEAMKAKDTIKKNTIQMIRSGILQVEKDNQIVLDDEGVMDVIIKELKKREDSLPDFEKSGREDLIETLKTEIGIIEDYLPPKLSEEEIQAIIQKAIETTNASSMKEMGKVMALITPEIKGRADTKKVSQQIKSILSGN